MDLDRIFCSRSYTTFEYGLAFPRLVPCYSAVPTYKATTPTTPEGYNFLVVRGSYSFASRSIEVL